MKTFRIGNPVPIKWPILTNGKTTPLDGRVLSLFLVDPQGVNKEVTFETDENCVYYTYSPLEQKRTGVYSLILYQDIGTENQLCVDTKAFRLVAHSYEIPSDMSEEEIELDSRETTAIRGSSAYEIAVAYGFTGTEEEWAAQYNTVLTSVETMIAQVAESRVLLEQANELKQELVDVMNVEAARVQTEALRVEAENVRVEAEQGRANAEAARVIADQGRMDAEAARVEEEHERNVRSIATQNGIVAYEESLRTVLDQIEQQSQLPINDRRRTLTVVQTQTIVELQPNVMNVWEEPVDSLAITFATGAEGYENEFMFRFTCPAETPTSLYLPDVTAWADGTPLETEPGWTYELSVINGLAAYAGYEPSE